MICELVLIYGAWVNPCNVTHLEPREYRKYCTIRV